LIFETLLLLIEISFFRWLSLVRGLDFGNVVFFGVRRQTCAVEISFVILCGYFPCVIHISPLGHISHLANSEGNTLDYVVGTGKTAMAMS
jgi:CheY-like chemotaxis protein